MVYAFNDHGCIKIPAELTKRVRPGMVAIGEGAWYRASATETYEAWLDTNGDGTPEKNTVPVDVGGNPNSITPGMSSGSGDVLVPLGYGFAAGGNLCEVSKTHPDNK
jgi:anaerobic dimethyl sulfoxide reductase subunit A